MNAIVKFRKYTLTDAELVERVDKATDEMYKTGKLPSRNIPARPDYDFDLLVGELVFRFYHKIVKPADGDAVIDTEQTDGEKMI